MLKVLGWRYNGEEVSGIGGGILLRTNPPGNSEVGNMYFSHCYFENNYAARQSSGNKKDGWGRGFYYYFILYYIIILYIFYFIFRYRKL
jgi:hypothetical protein